MSQNFIDISGHQSNIRVRDVPTDALIVKATEGRGWRDKSMPGFVAQARAADLPLGFYHYVSQGNTPQAEADNLLAYTNGHRRDSDLLVLDWEPIGSNPGTRNVDWARRFLEHLTGRAGNPVWTYMNLSTANGANWKPVTSRWPLLWLAHYPGNNKAAGYNPAGNRGHIDGANGWRLAAWQFTDGGRLPGFGGNLDLNELYIPWWEGGGTTATPTDALLNLPGISADTLRKATEVVAALRSSGRSISRIWGFNPASRPEHSSGRALDFMCDRPTGNWIADYLWEHRTRLRVKWIIWWQRIRSTSPGKPGTWEQMADRGDPTQNHMDHVHVFFDDGYTAPAGGIPTVAVPGWDGKPIRGGILTTPYGRRGKYWSTDAKSDPRGWGIHTGDDWNLPGRTPIGTPLHAVVDGTVTIADGGALGLMSILKGDNGRYYRYCHCRKGSRDPWNGERVRAGQKIAEVGDTGNITAPHLHLEDTASAQLWPPVGHRKPTWPTPTHTPPSPHIEEDPVPDFNRTVTELDHPGQTDPNDFDTGWRLPADDATVVPPSGKRLKIDANAIVHVPEGVQLTTRWVSWSGRPDPGWVRGANRRHESNQAETVHKGEQAWAGADLRLDVHVDKPCKVWIEQTAWTWELDD